MVVLVPPFYSLHIFASFQKFDISKRDSATWFNIEFLPTASYARNTGSLSIVSPLTPAPTTQRHTTYTTHPDFFASLEVGPAIIQRLVSRPPLARAVGELVGTAGTLLARTNLPFTLSCPCACFLRHPYLDSTTRLDRCAIICIPQRVWNLLERQGPRFRPQFRTY